MSVSQEQHRGQLRMAERFVRLNTGRHLYAHGIGWHQWDGSRWVPDKDNGAMRGAIQTVKAALADLPHLDKPERDSLYKDVRKCESASGLEGMLRIAASLKPMAISADQLDQDGMLFNTPNGTIDLRTGEKRPHNPADLITKVAGCDLDTAATGEAFNRFITEILPNDKENNVRGFTQRVFGYSMLGLVREHVLPIFTGTGSNGKSTLLEVMGKAFGDYAINAEPELLVARGEAHPTGLADLKGARLAVCSETDEGKRLAAATMKRLCGGEHLRARKMRKDFFEFAPSHTLILATNHKPKVSGDDPAVWRRIRVVPFDFVAANPDVKLPERLAEELPAVLAWAYQGYLDYDSSGLTPPRAVTERTDKYHTESDPLGRFIHEVCVIGEHVHIGARDIYAQWAKWCDGGGEEPGSEVLFAESMGKRGYEKKRSSRGYAYRGIALATDAQESP